MHMQPDDRVLVRIESPDSVVTFDAANIEMSFSGGQLSYHVEVLTGTLEERLRERRYTLEEARKIIGQELIDSNGD